MSFAAVIFTDFDLDIFEGDERVIVVKARQFEFDPYIINVTLNEPIRLYISSEDVPHGFELPEFNVINQQIPVGQNVTVSLTPNKLGVFYFYCTVFCGIGHSDHLGELHVFES